MLSIRDSFFMYVKRKIISSYKINSSYISKKKTVCSDIVKLFFYFTQNILSGLFISIIIGTFSF